MPPPPINLGSTMLNPQPQEEWNPRVFNPDCPVDPWADDTSIAESMTVKMYYDEVVKRTIKKKGTLDGYRTSLARWQAFCAAFPIPPNLPHRVDNDRTRCPVIAMVTTKSLCAFQDWLLSEGHSNRTVNKDVGNIRTVLSRAAKRGVLKVVPTIQRLPENKSATIQALTKAEFSRIYHACQVAAWPRQRRQTDLLPGRWPLPYCIADGWRALLVMFFTYGMRTEDLIRLSDDCNPLCWSNIVRSTPNPHPAGKRSNRWGWLVFTPDKTTSHKPEPLVLPLTQMARVHLDRLDPSRAASPADEIFLWPMTSGNVKKNKMGFYLQLECIMEAAGVKRRSMREKSKDRYTPKHFRSTCITWLENHRAGSSAYITGHADDRNPNAIPKVQRDHYFSSEELVLDTLNTIPVLGGWAS